MRGYNHKPCYECGEEMVPNSAVYDGYGREEWYCHNEDCDNYWLDNQYD